MLTAAGWICGILFVAWQTGTWFSTQRRLATIEMHLVSQIERRAAYNREASFDDVHAYPPSTKV